MEMAQILKDKFGKYGYPVVTYEATDLESIAS